MLTLFNYLFQLFYLGTAFPHQTWLESLFQTPTPQFFKFYNPTPAKIINPTLIHPCFYLRNDHTDSCRSWKVTPDSGLVFPKFLTPGPKEKHRILSESTPVIRIRSCLCPTSLFVKTAFPHLFL